MTTNNEEFIGLFSSLHFNTEQYKHYDELKDFDLMSLYIENAIEMGSVDALFYMGNYYDEIKDYEKMKEYYEKGAEKNNLDAIYNLGHFYKEQKKFEEMKKWFLKGIELQDPDCMCDLAKYYEQNLNSRQQKENVKKYYLMAIDLNYLRAYNMLGMYLSKNDETLDDAIYYYIKGIDDYRYDRHYKIINYKNIPISDKDNLDIVVKMMEKTANYFEDDMFDLRNAIKYYEMAAEKKSIPSMYNLGRIHYEKENYVEMEKYLLMGIELKDVDCMFELAIYYQMMNDIENMEKYYLMALSEKPKHNAKKFINDGVRDFNLFKVKQILENVTEPTYYITEKLSKIKSNKEIMIFENKKNLFTKLNHHVECGICYDVKLNINLNCGHCVCIECYPHLFNKACPFCRL